MFKLLLIFTCFVAATCAFDYVEFQRKYCYDDTNIRATAFYFPYGTGHSNTLQYGYVCENFVLTKEDLDFMARNSFMFSSQNYVLFKNCEIAYFNEYLVSRFPNMFGLYFENCNLSLKNPLVIESISAGHLRHLGFYKCNIYDNLNTLALQKFVGLVHIFIQNSTLQYSQIDEHFLPKKNDMYGILIDNVNVKSFHKGLLENLPNVFYYLTCSSCQLQEIDSLFFKMKQNIHYSISFDNNAIRKLPSSLDIFANFSNLPEIHLSGNEITEEVLKRIHFKSLKNLKVLDLSRNTNINSISYLTFKDTNLQNLNMSNVNLKHLEKLGNANLTTIDFSHNGISTIKHDVFEDLINLKFLDIGHNKIEEFQGAAFQSLRILQELRLNFNQICEIPRNLFNNLVSLRILDLSNNLLDRLDGLEKVTTLQELYIQNNYLKMIPSSISIPRSLRILDISNNSLTFVGRNSFSNLDQLISLDISYTNNTYVDFVKNSLQPLKSLQILKLKGNKISSIEDVFLPTTLKKLDLGFNKILAITRKGLEGLINLEYLNLTTNHIHEIEKDVMEELLKIEFIDLSGNDI